MISANIIIFPILLLLSSCGESQQTTLSNEISFVLENSDVPKMARTYTARLARGIALKISCEFGYRGTIYRRGELTQPDGRWVFFEPERPADKILDRDILPDVERLSSQVISADKEWRASNPSEFIDERGTVWRRAQ